MPAEEEKSPPCRHRNPRGNDTLDFGHPNRHHRKHSLMKWLAISFFLGITAPLAILAGATVRRLGGAFAARPLLARLSFIPALLILAHFLLRPHQDTFLGLDTSCYRLMTAAFQHGRGFHEADRALAEVPPALQRAFLLESTRWGRDTRDRSFELPDLKTLRTRPFFYPTLPLASWGFSSLTGMHPDMLMPMLGFLWAGLMLFAALALGGPWGLAAGFALLSGTPLPAWFLRGYYAEVAAAVIAGSVLLAWALAISRRILLLAGSFLLGVAISLHPVAISFAAPGLILVGFQARQPRRDIPIALLVFAAALLPMLWMTASVCQPYGNLLSWHSLRANLRVSAAHQLMSVAAVLAAACCGTLLAFWPRWEPGLARWRNRLNSAPGIAVAVIVACLPLVAALTLWHQKHLVAKGLCEYGSGIRWTYGTLLAVAAWFTLRERQYARFKVFLLILLALSPIFFYLRGFERLPLLWSHRRLAPLAILLITAAAPALAIGAASWSARTWRRLPVGACAVAVLVLAGGFVNPLRWPAPYTSRFEGRTERFVKEVKARIGQRLAIFDFFPNAVPFTTDNRSRVLGLSDYARDQWPAVVNWMASRAATEEVWCVSAFSNPGIEDGIRLESIGVEERPFNRVGAPTALPAVRENLVVHMDFLAVHPLAAATNLPVLRKIFDGGPLAQRGRWIRSDIFVKEAEPWIVASRGYQGNGVIGPVPAPGGAARITVEAALDGAPPDSRRELIFRAPWGRSCVLTIGPGFSRATGLIARPRDMPGDASPTGFYRMTTDGNAGPANSKPRDLGLLVHSVTIEPLASP